MSDMMRDVCSRISTISFDVANTIEVVKSTHSQQVEASEEIITLLALNNIDRDYKPEELRELLRSRFRRFHCWRLISQLEPSPEDLWMLWLLPELAGKISPALADRLTHIWMGIWNKRYSIPESISALKEFKKRGYKIACICNTLSSSFTIQTLERYGLVDLLDNVTLSSSLGYRKPHQQVFENVVMDLKVEPGSICHIGDEMSRDIIGAINSGFGCAVLIQPEDYQSSDESVIWPDLHISSLSDLLPILHKPC